GASTEIAVGEPQAGPDWVRSVDLGSVRLSERVNGPDAARAEASRAFADVAPPPVEAELAEALRITETKSERAIARRYGVHRTRARILPAGLVLLSEVQQRLGVPLH